MVNIVTGWIRSFANWVFEMSDFRDPSTIRYQQSLYHTRAVEDESRGLPPGYIAGFEPAIDDDSVRFTPGIANIMGQRVVCDESTWITDMTWRVTRIHSAYYTIFLDRYGQWFVDNQNPAVLSGQYGLYHPVTGERYLGSVYVDEEGNYTGVVSHKRIRAEDIDAGVLSADLIGAGEITVDKLAAGILNTLLAEITGYLTVDSDGLIAQSGDWRALVTESKFAIQQLVEGVWTDRLKMGVSTGGVTARLFYGGGLVGILNGLADLDIGHGYPYGSILFSFDSGYTDRAGADPWDTKSDVRIAGTEGLYTGALACAEGATAGYLEDEDAHGIVTETAFSISAWWYFGDPLPSAARDIWKLTGNLVLRATDFDRIDHRPSYSPFDLYGVGCNPDSDTWIVVGRNAYVVRVTWEHPFNSPTEQEVYWDVAESLSDVDCYDGVWVAVGESGFMLRSTDDGVTWNPVSSGVPFDIWGVCGADGVWVACGQGSDVYRSTDAGLSWSAVSTPSGHNHTGIHEAGGTWLCACSSNAVERSTDNGASWTEVVIPNGSGATDMYNAVAGYDGVWVAVGQDGYTGNGLVARSTDDGLNWTTYDTGESGELDGVAGAGDYWVAVSRWGYCVASTDGGASWSTMDSFTTQAIWAVAQKGAATQGWWMIAGDEYNSTFAGIYTRADQDRSLSFGLRHTGLDDDASGSLSLFTDGRYGEHARSLSVEPGWNHVAVFYTQNPMGWWDLQFMVNDTTSSVLDTLLYWGDVQPMILRFSVDPDYTQYVDDLLLMVGAVVPASDVTEHVSCGLPWAGTDVQHDIVLKADPTGKITALDKIACRDGLEVIGAAILDQLTADGIATFTTNVLMTDLPTSMVGLPSGSLWNDSGTVKIVT